MLKHRREAAPKSSTPSRQTALSHGQRGPEAKAGLLLEAQQASGVPDDDDDQITGEQSKAEGVLAAALTAPWIITSETFSIYELD